MKLPIVIYSLILNSQLTANPSANSNWTHPNSSNYQTPYFSPKKNLNTDCKKNVAHPSDELEKDIGEDTKNNLQKCL